VTTSEAQKRAAIKHRQSRRRVELLLDQGSPESRALDRLIEAHGSVAAAVRFALLNVK
jgi:hypothetical protein